MLTVYINAFTTSFGINASGGISIDLYFSGCSREPKCSGCHNPTLWERDDSCIKDVMFWEEIIEKNLALLDSVVFLGGEPLDQEDAALWLSNFSHGLGLKTWLYTGREYKDLSEDVRKEFDVIVSGEFDENLINMDSSIPASTNQVVTRRNECVKNHTDS